MHSLSVTNAFIFLIAPPQRGSEIFDSGVTGDIAFKRVDAGGSLLW